MSEDIYITITIYIYSAVVDLPIHSSLLSFIIPNVRAVHPKLRQISMLRIRLPGNETAQHDKLYIDLEKSRVSYLQEFTAFHQPPH
jgi:hypothetical protein